MSYGEPPSGQPGDPGQYGAPQYGQPQPPQYGEPPQYGQPPQYGEPQYGQQPGYGQPAYGQPAGYGQPLAGPAPSGYVGAATAAMIAGVLFSLIIGFPCGIVALTSGRKVKTAWAAGDQAGALRFSKRARTWLIVSVVFDVIGLVLFFYIVSRGGSNSNG